MAEADFQPIDLRISNQRTIVGPDGRPQPISGVELVRRQAARRPQADDQRAKERRDRREEEYRRLNG